MVGLSRAQAWVIGASYLSLRGLVIYRREYEQVPREELFRAERAGWIEWVPKLDCYRVTAAGNALFDVDPTARALCAERALAASE